MLYSQARPNMQTGQALLWKGAGVIQNIIEKLAGGYSHGSIILRLDEFLGLQDRVWVVESNFTTKGLVLRLLSDALFEQHGKCFWLPAALTKEQQQNIKEISLTRIASAIKYDTQGIFEKLFDLMLPQRMKRATMHMDKIYCFGEVYTEWQMAGFAPLLNYAPTADDLIRASGVQDVIPIEMDINREGK